jgi:hypothetical protein
MRPPDVVARISALAGSRGFAREDDTTVRRGRGPIFALIHAAIDPRRFTVRLSIGLVPVSENGVILSTDLHLLISPNNSWYALSASDTARMERDMVEVGLPWVERHSDLAELTRALESALAPPATTPKSGIWPWRRGEADHRGKRINPLYLRALSHCYELQSRYVEALAYWREYLATRDPVTTDQLERMRLLEARSSTTA